MQRYSQGLNVRGVATLLLLLFCLPALAAPPAHAPAHGWRKKHDPEYAGYSGHKWQADYGVREGRCEASSIGAALGQQTGGDIGGEIGGDTGALVGSIVGIFLGSRLDAKLNAIDRGCINHALDLGEPGVTIRWKNPESGQDWELTPGASSERDGRTCREFEWKNGRRGSACADASGNWEIQA